MNESDEEEVMPSRDREKYDEKVTESDESDEMEATKEEKRKRNQTTRRARRTRRKGIGTATRTRSARVVGLHRAWTWASW